MNNERIVAVADAGAERTGFRIKYEMTRKSIE
jgi:hypothetical protein